MNNYLNNYSFERCKEIIKDSYMFHDKEISIIEYTKYLIPKIGSLTLSFIYCLFSLNFFVVFLILPLEITTTNSLILSFLFLNLLFSSYKFCKYLKLANKTDYSNKEKTQSKIINKYDYFLPLSKNELLIILKDNINLRKYAQNNPDIIYSQYEIDKTTGIISNNNCFKQGKEITASFLNINDINFTKIKETINKEQKKAIYSN